MNVQNKIDKILGNIEECPHCMGDGLDENMKTCRKCDGSGEVLRK